MTTTQSFRIYKILQRHFKNNDDAKIVVQEIEQITEAKIENKPNILATKADISSNKEKILNLRIDIEKRSYNKCFMDRGNWNGYYRLDTFNH